MTTQRFELPNRTKTEEELKEAEDIAKGLTFMHEVMCCDGYEQWSFSTLDYSDVAELIHRVRESIKSSDDPAK